MSRKLIILFMKAMKFYCRDVTGVKAGSGDSLAHRHLAFITLDAAVQSSVFSKVFVGPNMSLKMKSWRPGVVTVS